MKETIEKKLVSIKRNLYAKSKELEEAYDKATSQEEKDKIKAEHENIVKMYNTVFADLNNYRALVNKENKTEEENKALNAVEITLCKKYGMAYVSNEKKETTSVEEKEEKEKEETKEETEEVENVHKGTEKQKKSAKSKVKRAIAIILATVALLGAGHHAGKWLAGDYKEQTSIEQTVEDENKAADEKPFEVYGEFTDATDEKQVMERAQWYYDTYITGEGKLEAGTLNFTAEDIANNITFMNGEFMKDDAGNIDYNENQVIDVATDLHTIANYDSFAQYGNNIYFTPMAPLFEDGSLAQKGAIELDEKMAEVVKAIQADDKEAFMQAAEDWGLCVIQIFNYVDYDGQHVNIYQVDDPQAFFLYHMMSSKYASTILEYSEKNDINICVPYCVDYCSGETQTEALSQIMYNLNERALDAVAIRSGNLEEYEVSNPSLPQDLCISAKTYFASKYDVEKGYSLSK